MSRGPVEAAWWGGGDSLGTAQWVAAGQVETRWWGGVVSIVGSLGALPWEREASEEGREAARCPRS